jgi:hypothetical protein
VTLRRLRHRIFRKRGGLQRPCSVFVQDCVVCRYCRRKNINH